MIEFVDRRGTNCYKWDMRIEGSPEGVIPLWVADMDFRVADPILSALERRLKHGVFGYTFVPKEYREAISYWWERRHGVKVDPEWIVNVPGVVAGIAVALLAFSDEGDRVVVQPPVYWPFFSTIERNGREVVENPLVEENGYYTMDLGDLPGKLENSRIFILCNPHNPVGRVWKKEELRDLVKLLKDFDGIVISDEIHFDFVFSGVFTSMLEFDLDNLIVLSAPNKTFNIAGLKAGYAIIKNPDVRRKFERVLSALHVSSPNVFAIEATVAAYRKGEEWFDEILDYIRGNFELVEEELGGTGKVGVRTPEGTYLMWLDFRKSGLEDPFRDLLEVGVWLQDGRIFRHGEGFLRMNVGTSKEILEEALRRIVFRLGGSS